MTPAHRQCRRPSLFSELAADHPGKVIATVVAAVLGVLLVAVGVVSAPTDDSGSPAVPQPVAAVSTPQRPVTPESQTRYFAALFTDATIGPKDLTADNALRLGEHVCDDLRGGASLASLVAYVRGTTTLTPMQAARLVDAADRQLCPKRTNDQSLIGDSHERDH